MYDKPCRTYIKKVNNKTKTAFKPLALRLIYLEILNKAKGWSLSF